jgi:polyribonucleotide nucleotidyltransferase
VDVRVVEVDRERGRIGLRLAHDPDVAGKSVEELAGVGSGGGAPRGGRDAPRGSQSNGRERSERGRRRDGEGGQSRGYGSSGASRGSGRPRHRRDRD